MLLALLKRDLHISPDLNVPFWEILGILDLLVILSALFLFVCPKFLHRLPPAEVRLWTVDPYG